MQLMTAMLLLAAGLRVFHGASDASGAVLLGPDTLVVADDEDNVLRFYDPVKAGPPRRSLDLSRFLGVDAGEETDLEGGARGGDHVYWITSHGRDKKGRVRPGRHRLFAMEIVGAGPDVTLRPVGEPYAALETDLRAVLPEVERGFEVEALASTSDGSRLYLGLRSPLGEGGRAWVVPLDQPRALMEDGGPARLGEPLSWDLRGNGLRAMVRADTGFRIVDSSGRFHRWSGDHATPPTPLEVSLPAGVVGQPESLVRFPDGDRLLVLFDDGAVRVPAARDACTGGWRDGTCPNKRLRDSAARTFRGVELP